MEYNAADYFIDALGNTPNYCVNYENVLHLIDQAPKDVALYLKEEGDEDFLFIFKKFPDVFIVNESIVTLTDAFLCLYAFPNSSTFSNDNICASIFEVDAIEYLKLILIRCGTCHYNMLFDTLLYNKSSHLASYFSWYTTEDRYSFFQSHSNTFNVLNDNVNLKIKPLSTTTDPILSDKDYEKIVNQLKYSTYVLLLRFKSLHYIELKQCISFVLVKVKFFLNQHSLLKQREIFQNMEEVFMDELGYLTLKKNFDVEIVLSRKICSNLLMVCILAFEKEMHLSKLIEELKKRWIRDVEKYFLFKLSVNKQKAYFSNNAKFYVMQNGGYVNLLPSFIFPLCCFENSSSSLLLSQRLKTLNVCNYETGGQNIKLLHILPPYTDDGLDVKDSTSITNQEINMSSIIHGKLHSCVLFLQNCFHPLVIRHVLEAFLHALSSVKTYFFELTLNDQHMFIAKCFQFCECIAEEPSLSSALNIQSLMEDEEYLLFITYLLMKKKSIHYRKIMGVMNEFQLMPLLLCSVPLNKHDSACFNFFRNLSEYFVITGAGYVRLSSMFSSLSSVFASIAEIKLKTDICLSTQSETSLMCNKLKNQDFINTYQNTLENVDSKEEVEGKLSLKREIADDCAFSVEYFSASDIIIDVCISILSVSEKMQIEKLCNHLKSFNSSIQNYFSFHTVAEKLHFFSSFSEYFDVSRDGFVSLRKNVLQSYVPKTKYIKQDSNGHFMSSIASSSQCSNNSESMESCNSPYSLNSDSNVSSTSSVGLKKARGKKCVKKILGTEKLVESQIKADIMVIPKEKDLSVEIDKNIDILTSENILSIKDPYFCSLSTIKSSSVEPANGKLINFSTQGKDLDKSSKHVAHNTSLDAKASTGNTTDGVEMPPIICNKLHNSVHFLQNFFQPLVIKNILESFFHALSSAKTSFSDLTVNDQHIFIARCFRFCECAIEVPPLSSNTQPLIKDEKCLLFFTYLLIQRESLHYRNIMKEMKKFDLIPSLLSTISLKKLDSNCFKYFKNLSEYFVITKDGFVSLCSTFSSLSSVISTLSASTEEMESKLYLNTQSEASSTCNKLNNQVSIDTCKNIIENIDNTNEQIEGNTSLKEDVDAECALSVESYCASDIMIDICFSILTVSEKMQIETLCNYLKYFNIKSIQNYFLSYTEQLNYFLNLSQYFDISQDGFISLGKDVLQSYVPKTNYIKKDSHGCFLSCNVIGFYVSNKPNSTRTYDSPEILDSSSNLSSASSVRLKKLKTKRGRRKGSKEEQITKEQNRVDPLTIDTVSNFIYAVDNKKIDNSCEENNDTLTVKEKVSTAILQIQSENIKEENRESNYPENVSKLEQISMNEHLKQLNSFVVHSEDNQFKKDSNSIVEFHVNEQSPKSKPNKSEKILDSTIQDVIEENLKSESIRIFYSKTQLETNHNEKKTDVRPNENISKTTVLCNESYKIDDRLHNDEYKEIMTKSDLSSNENLTESDAQKHLSLEKTSQKGENTIVFNNCSDIIDLENESFKSHGIELLNSFLGELGNNFDVSNIDKCDITVSSPKGTHKQHNSKVTEQIDDKTEDVKNNVNSNINTHFILDVSRDLNSNSYLSDEIVEFRAVNFYCAILGNNTTGLSEYSLMEHLNLASVEVQEFISSHYNGNILSFFKKHEKYFYISPETNCVNFVKKS